MWLSKIIPRPIKQWVMRLIPGILCATESYSQSGEDLIVNHVLRLISGDKPFRYVDIGANDAFWLSNTALFYKNRGSGVLIETNPVLADKLNYMRGDRDSILQCGVHFTGQPEAAFIL